MIGARGRKELPEQQPMIRRRKKQEEKNTPHASQFLTLAFFHSCRRDR
jgi:hypothetical protein